MEKEKRNERAKIFIDRLLQDNDAGIKFSESDIRNHVFTMVSAVSCL